MLRFVKPDNSYKSKCIDYIDECYKYKSIINGVGKLDYYLKNYSYEEWLNYLSYKETKPKDNNDLNSSEFLLVNEKDDIIGMVNIRHFLNERYKKEGGHIGYSIRPTERRKGYNKISLYLALLECEKLGIKKVLITCDDKNIGSYKSIEVLGGILDNKIYYKRRLTRRYYIDVDKSIKKYKNIYGNK